MLISGLKGLREDQAKRPNPSYRPYAPINGLPQNGGGGGGQPLGNLKFSGLEMSISLPLGLQ